MHMRLRVRLHKNPMRGGGVINRFVTVLKKAKPKKGGKSTNSDLAHMLDLSFCHQNRTKLLPAFSHIVGYY